MTNLPCGHPITGSLTEQSNGNQGLNLTPALPPSDWGPGTIPAKVHCESGCGWVDLTDEQHEELKEVRV